LAYYIETDIIHTTLYLYVKPSSWLKMANQNFVSLNLILLLIVGCRD